MNREDFLHKVLSQPDFTRQFDAAQAAVRQSTAFDGTDTSSLASRLAAIERLKASQQDILSLLGAPVPPGIVDAVQFAHQRVRLVTDLTTVWTSQLKRLRYRQRHRVARRAFRPEHIGAVAYRDAEHETLRMRTAATHCLPRQDGLKFEFAAVQPFVDHRVAPRTRAGLYLRWLVPGRVEPRHLRHPLEQSLVGQEGVFARTDIPAGTCLGVYGGQLMDEADVFLVKDDRYLLGVGSAEPGIHAINGENLLSLTNTIHTYDEQGRPNGHPESGYDLHRATFDVQFYGGWQVGIPAFFASRDIPAGTEIRWNYMLQTV